MNKGLSEIEKLKLLRPNLGNCEVDAYQRPIVKKIDFSTLDWNQISVINLNNASGKQDNSKSLLTMFSYDKVLMRLWNAPFKKVGLWQSFAAVCTPDFSVYPQMNINEISHNIFMSRWLGATWQICGCNVIPTAVWSLPDTYDLCFEGIERGSVVAISTMGCHSNSEVFLAGFNEMRKRINPPLIIVYGNMINGMTGTFVNFKYTEAFPRNHKQLSLFDKVFTIAEDTKNGF